MELLLLCNALEQWYYSLNKKQEKKCKVCAVDSNENKISLHFTLDCMTLGSNNAINCQK
jgi:hypothetical protein